VTLLIDGQPRLDGLLKNRQPLDELGGKPVGTVSDGDLAMMAVEGAEMELAGMLD
jgi:hypothetical protein